MKKRYLLYLVAALLFLAFQYGRGIWHPFYLKAFGQKRTVQQVINKEGQSATLRLKALFKKAKASYPPQKIALLGIKENKTLELWAYDKKWKQIHRYPILAASGTLGPKLREGDRQVPEGIYKIEYLNPNSSYHLSMKLNYPNPFDLIYAKKEGRKRPGTNIFIHGRAASIGCLAMGDPAIEELFTLVQKIGPSNVSVIISPTDPRGAPLTVPKNSPAWVSVLYKNIRTEFLKIVNSD